MKSRTKFKYLPWKWVPTLYFAEGLPYVMVITVSVIMYKGLGVNNTDIALYTSWFYLPWVIKPIWSPFVDILKSKRYWILLTQILLGGGLAAVGFTIPTTHFLQYTFAFFWIIAFTSATHDIAADGYYMIALKEEEQSFFVGIRSTFYRIAMITGQGLVVFLVGTLEDSAWKLNIAWSAAFIAIALLFVLFVLYHNYALPQSEVVTNEKKTFNNIFKEFGAIFLQYIKKPQALIAVLFFLTYRLGESQLVKIAAPFLMDTKEVGGYGLSTSEIGYMYGVVGTICLTIGGILGGIVISRNGLKYWIWIMALAMNLPNMVYVYLSYVGNCSEITIMACIAIEQFGYGFGFAAFLMYMIYFSQGEHKTAFYAISTGIMALGMMLPGMISGYLQELIGYKLFFIWVLICTIPGFVLIKFLRIEKTYGKK